MTGHIVTRQRRQLAAAHSLLSSAPVAMQARAQWQDAGVAWLQPHPRFRTIVVRAGLLHAVLGVAGPEECGARLAEALEGGPVFCSADACGLEAGYALLLPAHLVSLLGQGVGHA